jgi:hypothetical protein
MIRCPRLLVRRMLRCTLAVVATPVLIPIDLGWVMQEEWGQPGTAFPQLLVPKLWGWATR